MPEHDQVDKERVLSGEVTETPSSDNYIARNLATLRSEIEATGKIIDISASDVLRPKFPGSNPTDSNVDAASKIKVISDSPLRQFASEAVEARQVKKAA